MPINETNAALAKLFSELVEGTGPTEGAFIVNSGDAGLLRSLDKLSASDASLATDGGATIAAHTRHLSYGLSLMNRWAAERGDPFSDAKWDEAWKTRTVDAQQWEEIRNELREQTTQWRTALSTVTEVSQVELLGVIGSVAHLAYHLGAIRQIGRAARGPREEASRAASA